MEINLGGTVIAPFVSEHVLGPMMVWPPANALTDIEGSGPSAAAQVAEEVSEAICLPDLSAENPFA